MILLSEKSKLTGRVEIPASKSHTIRALALATLAHGESVISNPLDSADARSCVVACRALGAQINIGQDWIVTGTGGDIGISPDVIDVGNSGTTLYIALGMASLAHGCNIFTGDAQTRRRSAQNLIGALNQLGARIESSRNNGCAPIIVRGPMTGGEAVIACPTSQYLTSLLISAPFAENDTYINVTQLFEEPYVAMTLDWMAQLNIDFSHENMRHFRIPGGQEIYGFNQRIKGDFSSATFFICAAAITGSKITLDGLDMNDAQGDKEVVHMVQKMGATVKVHPRELTITGGALKGADFDLNATPDALPALAITACFAQGTTRLLNVPQARMKETDRIAVMREVVEKLGGKAEELPDGLIIHGSGGLRGGAAFGHGDHRVVMACAVAGLASDNPVEVDTAEAVAITFPNFVTLMKSAGGRVNALENT